MSSNALALAIAKPGVVSGSNAMTFGDVDDDARKRLDEKYRLME